MRKREIKYEQLNKIQHIYCNFLTPPNPNPRIKT
jgi:hypothetical protein